MKTLLLCILLVYSLLAGCGNKAVPIHTSFAEKGDSTPLYLSVQAIDLSEDVATVSSGDDELVLLVYGADSLHPPVLLLQNPPVLLLQNPPVLLLQSYMQRNQIHRDTLLTIPDGVLPRSGKLYLWLLEMDSERPLHEIEAVVRKNQQALIKAYRTGNASQIRTYLQDEDLLDFQEIPINGICCEKKWLATGIHLFDRYSYALTLTRQRP